MHLSCLYSYLWNLTTSSFSGLQYCCHIKLHSQNSLLPPRHVSKILTLFFRSQKKNACLLLCLQLSILICFLLVCPFSPLVQYAAHLLNKSFPVQPSYLVFVFVFVFSFPLNTVECNCLHSFFSLHMKLKLKLPIFKSSNLCKCSL